VVIFRRWDSVQFNWLDTGEVGQLLFDRAHSTREDSKCNITGDIWDKARGTGLATKTRQGYGLGREILAR
jgi:hypothetical protein